MIRQWRLDGRGTHETDNWKRTNTVPFSRWRLAARYESSKLQASTGCSEEIPAERPSRCAQPGNSPNKQLALVSSVEALK